MKSRNVSYIYRVLVTVQKMKFSIKDFFSKCDQIHWKLLVTFKEEVLNGKLHLFVQLVYKKIDNFSKTF